MAALLHRAFDSDVTSVLMHDAARNPKSKPCSMNTLRGKERIEYAASHIGLDTAAGVGYRDAHTLLSRLPPGDVTGP